MPEPILTVPAPWGLPILLGLQTTWKTSQPVAVGQRLQVVHGPSGADFSKVLAWCDVNLPPYKHLMDVVPWNMLLPSHNLGSVQVAACDPPCDGQAYHLLHFSDPRPSWAQPLPQPASRPGSQTQPPNPRPGDSGALDPTSSALPAAGPLFQGR